MTMPRLTNCPHSNDGWCLECVERSFSLSETKVWGEVRHLFYGPVCTSLLRVERGTYCSIHHHEKRWNHFLVARGAIDVVLYNQDQSGLIQICNRVQLAASQGYAVAPKVIHRFEVRESGWLIEGYWTDDGSAAKLEDIVRLREGGRF